MREQPPRYALTTPRTQRAEPRPTYARRHGQNLPRADEMYESAGSGRATTSVMIRFGAPSPTRTGPYAPTAPYRLISGRPSTLRPRGLWYLSSRPMSAPERKLHFN